MRGAHIGTRNPELTAGITPAYAGSTVSFLTSNGSPWNHPRVCGEHISNPVGVITIVGSSPRMRGTPKGAATAQGGHEIIPAYAGNTRGQGAWSWWAWDHPRVCGKHGQVHAKPVLRTGSSPRMRGARGYRSEVLGVVRIIPAYAGSTCTMLMVPPSRWDHPRVCREHTTKNGGNTPFPTAKTTEKLQFKHSSLIKQHS